MTKPPSILSPVLAALLAAALAGPAMADSRPQPPAPPPPSYADLADLADGAPLIVRAVPRKIVAVEPERAKGVRAGWGRFYVEAQTQGVIFGATGLGQKLTYLVDLPLDAKGKPPAIKKKSVVLFARPVPGRPGELQLVARDAQLLWDPALDVRLRGVVGELNTPDAPRRVTGVREVIFVPGNLAGESETQIFLATGDGEPAAITVSRQPGTAPRWSVSFSEVVGDAASAPPRDTLTWYRLACFLPQVLPGQANTSGSQADRAAAGIDYRFVLDQLGPCSRTRR